jgi:hypothetical protein
VALWSLGCWQLRARPALACTAGEKSGPRGHRSRARPRGSAPARAAQRFGGWDRNWGTAGLSSAGKGFLPRLGLLSLRLDVTTTWHRLVFLGPRAQLGARGTLVRDRRLPSQATAAGRADSGEEKFFVESGLMGGLHRKEKKASRRKLPLRYGNRFPTNLRGPPGPNPAAKRSAWCNRLHSAQERCQSLSRG